MPQSLRRGPRPLALHLMLAGSRGMAALAMQPGQMSPSAPNWPSLSAGWPRSKAGLVESQRIAAALAAGGHRPEAFRAAVLRRLLRADRALLAGIAAYRRHPFTRDLPDPPAIWTEGSARLLDYGIGGRGPLVLFVPSLINRAQVLDLTAERSLLRFLAQQGMRPLLLDWGWPGEAERGFTLTDTIAGRLERAIAAAPGPVVLVGYCMGGLLALAAALRQPASGRRGVVALGLLATPWDFHADAATRNNAQSLAALLPGLEPAMQATGTLPVDAIQALFAGLDPFGVAQKYRAFARLDPASARAKNFVALEDWLNDGVPLAAPVAREAIGGWYGSNTPGRLAWRVAGQVVDPRAWTRPAFVAVPARDRIVPPASARALSALLPHATVHDAASGHIGMVAGQGAEAALWQPLLAWLRGL